MRRLVLIIALLTCFVARNAAADPPSAVAAAPETPAIYGAPDLEVTPPGTRLMGYGTFWHDPASEGLAGVFDSFEQSANFRVENGRILMSDGYVVVAEVLIDNEAVVKIRVTAESPDGRRAVAILGAAKTSGHITRDGMQGVNAILSESEDWRLFLALVSNLQSSSSIALGGPEIGSTSESLRKRARTLTETDACKRAQYSLAVLTAKMMMDCTLEAVISCTFDVLAVGGASATVNSECGLVLDVCPDEGCPTAEEPPCTSQTIC